LLSGTDYRGDLRRPSPFRLLNRRSGLR